MTHDEAWNRNLKHDEDALLRHLYARLNRIEVANTSVLALIRERKEKLT